MNYQLILDKELEIIKEKNKKPSLLLHSCCAPCSTYVLEYLNSYFDITIYYYNPNIDTEDEFKKRLNEQIKLINLVGNNIKIIEGIYEQEIFNKNIEGLENYPEGSKRCYECYGLRLESTAIYAKENKFDYFTTTLSVSPHKNARVINEIGESLKEIYKVKFLYADFKKKEGYKRSIELSKKYNLYRQDYCGCIYSMNNRKDI